MIQIGIRTSQWLVFFILLLSIPNTLQSQLWVHLISEGEGVSNAHLTSVPKKYLLVSDKDGWAEIPTIEGINSILITCIGFRDTIISLEQTGFSSTVEIHLNRMVVPLPVANVNAKPLKAKDVLKKARRYAIENEVPDSIVIVGRVGEFSKDNDKFIFAIEGEFAHIGSTAKFSKDTKITAIYKSRTIDRGHNYNTDGIDIIWVAQKGAPREVIQTYHLNQAKEMEITMSGSRSLYRIVCYNKDSTEISTFIISSDNYALVSAHLIWSKASKERNKSIGADTYEQIRHTEYWFNYEQIADYLILANAFFHHQIDFFQDETSPKDLSHDRFVTVEVLEAHHTKNWPNIDGHYIDGFRTLKKLTSDSYSWEEKTEKSNSPFKQTVLNDLRKQ